MRPGMEPVEVVRRSEMLLLIWTQTSVGEKAQDEMAAHIKVLVESLYWDVDVDHEDIGLFNTSVFLA